MLSRLYGLTLISFRCCRGDVHHGYRHRLACASKKDGCIPSPGCRQS